MEIGDDNKKYLNAINMLNKNGWSCNSDDDDFGGGCSKKINKKCLSKKSKTILKLRTYHYNKVFTFCYIVILVVLSECGPSFSLGDPDDPQQNSLRNSYTSGGGGRSGAGRVINSGGIGSESNTFEERNRGNYLIRRDSSSSSSASTSPGPYGSNGNSHFNSQFANLTSLILEVGRNCVIYCADQTQHNEVCLNKGCKKWKTGLRDGCAAVCNGSESNYHEFYSCQVGCAKAIEEYYFRVTGVVGVPDPPILISGSLKSSSLRLSWDGCGLPLPYLAFTVQRRFYHRANEWETIPSQQPLNITQFTVQQLKSFTEYQFRIGWILAHDFPPFYSRESNPIETLPKGLPNAPDITSIQPISNTSVAITWIPPTEPNGRLIAYILKLQKNPNGHAIIKEIPMSQNPRGYTFSSLEPITNYSLAISAQNLEGEGDAAKIYFVTPQSAISNEVSKGPEPRLLLQGFRDVYLQHLDLLMEPDVPVFATSQNVSAMAAHFKYKWVFIATSEGQIIRTGLERNHSSVIVPKERLDLFVSFLSIDWLHNKLYIVGKKRRSSAFSIKRCDLNGERLVTIYPYLSVKPVDFGVDPFTGYLYWVSPPSYTLRGGLYKLDLISDEFISAPVPQPVIEDANLGPFTIDVPNYRIFIVHKGRNTVLSVSLDGDITDIRQNTQSPQFGEVESLASYNGLFYWTTGESVVIEEYNGVQDSFYHNSFDVPKVHQPLSRLIIVHPELQPTPVPMAPPQNLQVLYGETRARVSWKGPPPISGLGDGAWREWKYQIRISDNRSISNISGTEFIINDLRPSTFYTIQVLAYSASGRGPLSKPNRGKTLRETPYNITLLWGSQNGLYSTNTLGEDVKLLTSSPSTAVGGVDFKGTLGPMMFPSGNPDFPSGGGGNPYMWSLTWYESSVFFAMSNGSVFYYDNSGDDYSSKPLKDPTAGPKVSLLKGVSYARSIAFDYIGQRLYWSNPKQQTIFRCSFATDGGTSGSSSSIDPRQIESFCGVKEKVERLQLVTVAKEITIDSYKGLLFWSTGLSLEMSRMNGYSHGTLHSSGLFSGVQIMGITLDTDQSRIYWISRSTSGSTLQRLSYNIRAAQMPMVIAKYEDISITGPIRYFNDRLIWLQGTSEAVITDLYGQGTSTLKISSISNITNLHVKDQSSLRYPGGLSKNRVQVNPDPVMKWSVVIGGKWNNFTVAWQPVNNTNYGKILYEVVINNTLLKITAYPNITVENSTTFKPYTEIDVSITSLTYWSSAKPTLCKLKTPSWKPSEPQNPRVYIEKASYPYFPSSQVTNRWKPPSSVVSINNSTSAVTRVTAELRWDAPQNPNGLILGYLIHCWKDALKKTDCMCEVDLSKLSCEIHNLSPHSQYHFSVQAYTDSGAGKLSTKVLADTGFNTPVPKLLITSTDKLEILDIDRNHLETIQLGYLSPVTAGFLASDKTVFWFNEGQDLMKAEVVSPSYNKTRVLALGPSGGSSGSSINKEASHLAVDWIGRKLYWASESLGAGSSDSEFKYGIMTYDLSTLGGDLPRSSSPKTIINSKTQIKSVGVNPFRNEIYWTTSRRNGITTLFVSESDGSSVRPFLSRDHENCNCSGLTSTGEAVAFDPNGFYNIPRGVLFIDRDSIWMSDEFGCNCLKVVNISQSHGSPRRGVRAYGGGGTELPFKIAGDHNHVYWAGGYLFASEKSIVSNGVTELLAEGVREINAFGPTAQPFPDLNCLIPRKMDPKEPLLFNHSSHSLHLNLPKAVTVNCTSEGRISLPTNKYEVYYGTVDQNGISKCTPTSPSFCKVVKTLEGMLHITDLHPYTTYTVFVTLTNYYAEKEGVEPLVCAPIMLRTAPGAPMPPKLLRLEPLSPVSVRVVWRQPEKLNGEKVWYQINWKKSESRSSPTSSDRDDDPKWADESRSNHNRTEFYIDLIGLLPGSNYTIWVVAFSEKGDAFSESIKKSVNTFPHPNNITLVHATPHNLTLVWMPPNDTSILRHQIMYRDGWSSIWNFTQLINFTIPGRIYNLSISHLKPKTLYGFRIKTWYAGDPLNPYIWPWEGQFNFETLADKPGPPGQPIARGIGKALYEVSWEKADENGAVIEMYALEYKVDPSSVTYDPNSTSGTSNNSSGGGVSNTSSNLNGNHQEGISGGGVRKKREWTDGTKLEVAEKLISSEKNVARRVLQPEWVLVYNGTESRWQVEGLDLESHYAFRVRAKNTYGWGEYSSESGSVSLAALTLVAEPQSVGIIIGTIFLAFIILGALGILFIFLYRRKLNEKPALQSPSSSERREVELATLRELPGGSSFIHQSNILYAGGDLVLDLDLAGVPKISWHQISVTKFLGSGAFGEVYEGIALNLRGLDDPETKVAIKTLRKGANQTEKLEFIQEAKLMTQFKHPHIIQLLGICVDTDPCCLLLELMGGGDLLSYLRSNRPHLGGSTCLTLIDLLKMCVDVAKGCVCLEEMHFVHRDIAARNCLVQLGHFEEAENTETPDPTVFRVVKIGDFGLARDIYRNDYYRKEGEGLLPVRWMAPESLVDGVFTTQTDVWAFGVLLWEIMTLGQQPYPARNNLEVLNYVRGGGRLQKPPHCPAILGNLMLQCWEYNPDNRPSFKECLHKLEIILRDFEDVSAIDGLPPLNEINFDPYSYSEGGSETKSIHYGHQNYPDPDNVFLPPSGQDDQFQDIFSTPHHYNPYHQNHHHHPHSGMRSPFPKYLEVLSDSNSEVSPLPSFTDQGYEIPIPKKPPRNPKRSVGMMHPSQAEIGLPPPSYWNSETLPLHRQGQGQSQAGNQVKGHSSAVGVTAHYRNLLASSTSEDADIELEAEEESPTDTKASPCTISEHHYFPNIRKSTNNPRGDNNNSLHLRGVPCSRSVAPGGGAGALDNCQYFNSITSGNSSDNHHPSLGTNNYNNHSYAAHSLNNPVEPRSLGSRGVGFPGGVPQYVPCDFTRSNNVKSKEGKTLSPGNVIKGRRSSSHNVCEDSESPSLPASPTEYSPFNPISGFNNNNNNATHGSSNYISQYTNSSSRSCVNAINSG